MSELFICYSTKDADIALRVCAHLEKRGLKCWIAPRDVLPGMEYAEAIVDAISKSHAMVLIFSSLSNDSRQVKAEVQGAFEDGMTIIPFRIEDIKPTGTMKHFISPFQWIDAFDKRLEFHLKELADRLTQQLDIPVGEPSDAIPEKPTAEKLRRRPGLLHWGIALISLLIVVGIVLSYIFHGFKSGEGEGITAAAAARPLILTNGGETEASNLRIGVDGSDHAYIAGNYSGTVNIGTGPDSIVATSQGESDAYLMKLDPEGSLQWLKVWSNPDAVRIRAIAVDSSGGGYIAGTYRGTIDLDPDLGGIVRTAQGGTDSFIVKLDSSGTAQWAYSWGGSEYDAVSSIVLDDFRNIYIAGYFEGTSDFDPSSAVFSRTSRGSTDAYVVKLNPDGLFQWVHTWGGPEMDKAFGLTVDSSGDCYIVGDFMGAVDFEDGRMKHNSKGDFDAYMLKLDSSGTLLWAKSWGGPDMDKALNVVLDDTGNIYVSGLYSATADIDPGPGSLLRTSQGEPDAYILKFDPECSLEWVRVWGGQSRVIVADMVLSGSGNVLVLGTFQGTISMDSDEDTYTSPGGHDPFLVELDTSGSMRSMRTWGGLDTDAGTSMVYDGSGNLYVTGVFGGTADLDPGPSTANCTAQGYSKSLYLIKLDTSESLQWVQSWGTYGQNYVREITVDSSYNVFAAGYFEGTADLDPGAGTLTKTAQRRDDAFLLKLDPAGACKWGLTWGGSGEDQAHGVAIDDTGNIFVAGCFNGTIDLDPGPGSHMSTAQAVFSDPFLSKFDAAGSIEWSRTWGGPGDNNANKPAVDSTGNVYVIGQFSGVIDLDPGMGKLTRTSVGDYDSYLSKFDTTGSLLWAKAWGGSGNHDSTGIIVADRGDIYIAGNFSDTVDFDPGPDIHEETARGLRDSYLLKLDSKGVFSRVEIWGGKDLVFARGIALDETGNIYIVGRFEGSPDFDPGPDILNLPSQGDSDSFLIKLNPKGSLEWGRSWGGPDYDEARSIAYGRYGHLFIVGFFKGTTDLDPGPGIYERTAQGCDDDYIIKLDMDGNLIR